MILDWWVRIIFALFVWKQTGNSQRLHKKTSEELRAQGDEYYVPLSIRNAEQEAPLILGAEKPTKDSSKNSDAWKT